MKTQYQFIKFFASALLLISFFLPMSSCSYTVPINEDASVPGVETRTTIMYAREYLEFDEYGAWLNLLAFTWPVLLLPLQWQFRGRKYAWLLTGGGIPLSILSCAAVYTWADIGKPLVGAYVGGGAAIALFILYAAELTEYIRGRWSGKAKGERGKDE